MATTGSLITSSFEGRYYELSWSCTQSVANNTSTISWTLKALGGPQWVAERTLKVVIAGETVVNKTDRVERWAGTIASGTTSVTHDANGNASFSASIQAALYYSSVNCTGSGTFVLDTIPRKSTLTVADGTLGVSQNLTVTRLSTTFTHTVKYTCGNYSGTLATKSTATTIPFTPSLDFAFGAPNGTQVYVSFTIETFNGDTSIGSNSYAVWCNIPPSIVPSVNFEVDEAEGYFARFGSYIQGKSKLGINIQSSGSYGSTIKSCNTSFDGKTYTEQSFITDAIVNSGELDLIITVTDSRGRTASISEKLRVMAYDPPRITSLTIKRTDANGVSSSNGAYLTAVFDAQVTKLDENVSAGYRQNEAVFKAKYVNKGNSSDADETTFLLDEYDVKGGTYTFPANPSSSYEFTLIVDDFFTPQSNTPTTKTIVGGTARKTFSVFRRGLGFAFGKIAELEDFLEVNFKAYFYKDITIKGQPLADFIVEEGESDGWFYRKWNSGIAECWRIYWQDGVNAAAQNYSGFYYSSTISVPFPFVFTNLPTVTVDGGSVDYINFARVFGQYNDAASFTVVGLSNIASTDITVNIRAIGRWK